MVLLDDFVQCSEGREIKVGRRARDEFDDGAAEGPDVARTRGPVHLYDLGGHCQAAGQCHVITANSCKHSLQKGLPSTIDHSSASAGTLGGVSL